MRGIWRGSERRTAGHADHVIALERLLSRDPSSAVAQTALARVQQSQPDTGALAETAEQIRNARPEHPLGYYLTGLVLQRQGQLETSVEQFETTQALHERTEELQRLLHQLEDLERATANVEAIGLRASEVARAL